MLTLHFGGCTVAPQSIKKGNKDVAKLYKRGCHKCDGTGILPHYYWIQSGSCFTCGGLGYFTVKTDPAILDARKAKAAEKREAKKEAERQAHIKRNFWKKIASGIRQAVWAAEREIENANAEAIVNGKQSITGEIISTKVVDGFAYGQRVVKMVVKDDRGFKVWGTVPQAILDEYVYRSGIGFDADENYWNYNVLKGQRVTFSATVEASNDDDKFGFFKRPTKAAIAA